MGIAFEDLGELIPVGTGSFGKIFKADGTEVAVKTFLDISQNQEGSFDVKKYVDREVDILKEVRHPNVVQFMGCCISDKKLYVVTEYVAGGNVKDWIADETRPLGWRLRVSIAIDTARALFYLHAHDLIHRDMKSENLLVTENRRVKVCDFGLSRPSPKTAAEIRRMSFCGTDSHMAPEIILGCPFDRRVDIFSYGVVLCELATRSVAENQLTGSEGIVRRVIPGFGVDSDAIKAASLAGKEGKLEEVVEGFLKVALACAEDDQDKRPAWKEVLATLRALETELHTDEMDHLGAVLDEEHEPEALDKVDVLDVVSNDKNLEAGTISALTASVQTLADSDSTFVAGDHPNWTPTTQVHPPAADSLAPSPSLQLPLSPHRFSLLRDLSIARCELCTRRVGVTHRHLCCDDCGLIFHKRCGSTAPMDCAARGPGNAEASPFGSLTRGDRTSGSMGDVSGLAASKTAAHHGSNTTLNGTASPAPGHWKWRRSLQPTAATPPAL